MARDNDILPACAAMLAALKTTVSTMDETLDGMKKTVHNLENSQIKNDVVIKNLTEKIDNIPNYIKMGFQMQKKQKKPSQFLRGKLFKALIAFITAALMAATTYLASCQPMYDDAYDTEIDTMHRPRVTEDDAVDEGGGAIRFVDIDEPTTSGSIDRAEWNNAVMEEMIYIIEQTGGTIAASPSADRTAGWHQVYDAIFASASIPDAGISDVSATKVTEGTMNWFTAPVGAGSGKVFQLGYNLLYMSYDSDGSTDYILDVTNTQVQLNSSSGYLVGLYWNTGLTVDDSDHTTKVSGKGMAHTDGPGTTDFKSRYIRKSGFDLTSVTWSTSSGIHRATSLSYATTIPDTVGADFLINAAIYYNGNSLPAAIEYSESGGFVQIDTIAVANGTTAPATSFTLMLEYEANDI